MGLLDSVKTAFQDLFDAISSGDMDALKKAFEEHWPVYMGTVIAAIALIGLLSPGGGEERPGGVSVPIKIVVESGEGAGEESKG